MKPALNSITKHLQKQLKHKLYAQDFQSNLSIYPDKIGNSTISHYINHTNSTKFFNRITKLSTSTQKSKEKSRVFTRNPSSITNKPRTNHTVISTRNPSQNVPKKPWCFQGHFRRCAAEQQQLRSPIHITLGAAQGDHGVGGRETQDLQRQQLLRRLVKMDVFFMRNSV